MKSKFFLIPAIIFFSCSCFSQKKTDMGTANKLYKNDVFIDAVQIYKRVVEKGYHSMDIYEKLGNSYYFMGDFCEANKWYAKLFEYKRNMNYINYYRYSKVLMACGDKDKSAEISEAYTSKVDSLVRKTYAQIDEQYLLKIKTELRRYKLKTLPGINSTRSDYGVAFSGSKLVFASSRQKKLDEDYKKNFSKWTDESFFDLYYIEAKDKDLTIAPIKFSKGLDAVENKSTPAFTKDGNTMYFTGNDRLVDEISKERGAFLKIYKAEFIGGDWGNIVEVPFDNSAYNVAHPALSADEKVLYFASDMPGGLGDSDIYSVQIEGNNKFGKPVNLGPSVNTKGRESFPSVGPNGDLYFASNGRPGFGGLDIFVFPLDKKDKNTNIYNLGKPVNTRFDDFSITINPDNKSGFMSSNRNGGEGSDDILSFENTIELDFDKNKGFFNGLVVNSSNSIPLPNAKMSMYNEAYEHIKTVMTDSIGTFSFEVLNNKPYFIKTEKDGYISYEKVISGSDANGGFKIALDEIRPKAVVGMDLCKIFNMGKTYFELNNTAITKDMEVQFQKIIEVMKSCPTMKIEIRTHTDSRASTDYNQRLSDKRAVVILQYFKSKGIDSERIECKGFGESRLVNICRDGVLCTEDEHMLNRRIEVLVSFI